MQDNEVVDAIWKTMNSIRTAMLTTMEGGELHSRPMSAFARRDEHAIYFITRFDDKTEAIEQSAPVNLNFSDNSNQTWVSVAGHARVSQDRAKLEELWNTWSEAWLPEGPDAPDVALITVEPVSGKIWDSTSSKLLHAAKTLAAAVRQEPPKGDTAAATAL